MISPSPFLTGKNIYLRSLLSEDCEGPYVAWFNDKEVCSGNSHHIFPFTSEDANEYIEFSNKNVKDHLILAIISKESNQHIGNIALQNINHVARSAELSVIIGEKDEWGKGLGKEACRVICDHGFSAMNLNRIYCGTFDNNQTMKKIALYLGMKEEGCRRKAAYKNGRYIDIIEYGILKEEYESKWFS
jgi:[ribosomal protein S5]-alanine N-acetyltransferase